MTITVEKELEASQLLEQLLLLSAGLAHFRPKDEILAVYPCVAQFHSSYRRLDQQFREGHRIHISRVDRLRGLLSTYRPVDLVLATAHHGHFVAFFSACARAEIPMAACYRSASQSYLAALRQSGVALVDLDAMRSVSHIFDTFDELRAKGHYLALMIDAPFASRRRYQFLGYSITASSMPALYARRCGALLLPLIGHVVSEERLGYAVGSPVADVGTECTQNLLRFLEEIILEQPEQYAWKANSMVLSDASARENAFSFALDALRWRESMNHRI